MMDEQTKSLSLGPLHLDTKLAVRDLGAAGAILLVALYVLGYLARAGAAEYLNISPLGFEPSLSVVAGLPVLLLIAIWTFLAVYSLQCGRYARRLTRKWTLRVRIGVVLFIAVVGYLQTFWLEKHGQSNSYPMVSEALLNLVFGTAFYAALYVPEIDAKRSKWVPRLVRLCKWIWFTLSFCVILTASFTFAVNFLVGLPQSLGGFEPREALLDIDTAELSADTVDGLVFPATDEKSEGLKKFRKIQTKSLRQAKADGGSRVTMSTWLEVLRVDDRAVWVRHPKSLTPNEPLDETIELPRSAVKAISWYQDPLLVQLGLEKPTEKASNSGGTDNSPPHSPSPLEPAPDGKESIRQQVPSDQRRSAGEP